MSGKSEERKLKNSDSATSEKDPKISSYSLNNNNGSGEKNEKKSSTTGKKGSKQELTNENSNKKEKSKRNLRSSKKFVQILDNSDIRFGTIYDFHLYFEERPEDYKSNLKQALDDFEIPQESRRNGNYKKFYCYLLLDSRKWKSKSWKNAADWDYLKNPETGWSDFLDLIFYVGKGEGKRAWEHAEKAEEKLEANLKKYLLDDSEKTKSNCSVQEWIIDIWKSGGSVLIFIFADYIISEQAHTMEAAVIDATGLKNLTNKKKEHYYGVAATMTWREKCQLGATILMEAKNYFVQRGKVTDQQDPPGIMSSLSYEENSAGGLSDLAEDLDSLKIKQSCNI